MSTFATRALPGCLSRSESDDRAQALGEMQCLRARRIEPNGNDFDAALRAIRLQQAYRVAEVARTLYLPNVMPPSLRQVARDVAAFANSLAAMEHAPADDVCDALEAARKVTRLAWKQQP